MAEEDVLAHQLPGEPDLTTRAWEAGARFSRITENVARGEDPDRFHDGWMHSAGHRANILDSAVDSIGIALVEGVGRSFAVEDFARAVKPLSIDEQEKRVEQLIAAHGLRLRKIGADARKSCDLERDYAGTTTPRYVEHYETPDISRLPENLEKAIRSHRYESAAVGACPQRKSSGFTRFRIVVLLY
jgi:Cysteine-rich secretory protein family